MQQEFYCKQATSDFVKVAHKNCY